MSLSHQNQGKRKENWSVWPQVISKLPTPLVEGTVFWVEDAQQDFKCSIQVTHRSFFLPNLEQSQTLALQLDEVALCELRMDAEQGPMWCGWLCRDTFDEEKEADGMVLSGDVPATVDQASVIVASGTNAADSEKVPNDDEDLELVDSPAVRKRRRDEAEGPTAEKKMDSDPEHHVGKRTRLSIE